MVNETPIQNYCNKKFKNKHKERQSLDQIVQKQSKNRVYSFRAKTEYIHFKTQLKKINVLTFSFQPLNISNLLNNKYEDTKYSETYYNKNEVIYCHRYKRIKQENNTLCEIVINSLGTVISFTFNDC